MESQAIVHGQIIRKYKIPLNQIENLNNEYDKSFSQLQSFGDSLAGNLRIEKDVINLIGNLPIIHTLYACMQDCYKQNLKLQNIELEKRKVKDYMITQAWINCMQQGEYQPPHSHNINENGVSVGYSTVLFLKTPEIVVRNRKESLGGHLTFINSGNFTAFAPVVGDFYVFDAKHQHLVLPFITKYPDEIRRSMSFNYEIIFA